MAEKETDKKNNRLRNQLREEPVTNTDDVKDKKKKDSVNERRKTDESKTPSGPPRPNPLLNFIRNIRTNERLHKLFGAFLVFIVAPYLTVAFTSYFFTWQHDQDKIMMNAFEFLFGSVKADNMLGKFGALVSHVFIHCWFGITSFFFPFFFFLSGVRILLGVQWLPLGKTFRFGLFFMLFGSLLLGYFFKNNYFYLGGVFGYELSETLNGIIGFFGTGMLLLFAFVAFLIVAFNFSFKLPEKVQEETDQETKDTEQETKLLRNTLLDIEEEPYEEPVEIQEEPELVVEPEVTAEQTEEEPIQEIIDTNENAEIDLPVEEPVIQPQETDLSGDDHIQFTVEENKPEEKSVPEDEIEAKADELVKELGEYDPTLDLSSYQFPPIDLLEAYNAGKEPYVNTEELTANKNRIVETLANYGIAIDKIKATIGPTVTLYEINPAAGVRISKIKNLEDDIALSLSALGIRIIAPIPGKGTIGIEVPNQNPDMVPMRVLLSSEKFQKSSMDLPVALGKTISNEIFIADLAKMPHLLMAGATGQGKSVGLNAILVSLLYKKHPAQIKFVLVDPKKVELTLFNKIERHFLAKLPDSAEAIITDTKKVIHTLNSLCIEMDQRYDLLKDAQVRNLKEYNTKFIQRRLNPENGHRYLPYIVLVVDEFADLIMTAGKEVETPIARLAQLARAIGIHLIIATQRPSVNIITGTIKANFPARIAFRVTSKIDSRTILDAGGAEQLIGRGDMLYSTGNDLIRLQCAFVDTPEVEKITEFIGNQRAYPSAFLLPEYVDENGEGSGGPIDEGDRDALFEEAARIIVQHQQGSASLLQRKLKLGYNRAGRIVDQLEAAGIIGPFEGSKAREVLVKDLNSLEEKLRGRKDDNMM
ncbi:MAG: DNA translocase FtsK [Bacteroidia bacterium]